MEAIELWMAKQWVQSLVFGTLGGLGSWLLLQMPTRSKVLQVWVEHLHVGIGGWKLPGMTQEIKVSIGDVPVKALFRTVVNVSNSNLRDLSNVIITISSSDADIAAHDARVMGNSTAISFSPSFAEKIKVPNGQQPTDAQRTLARHNREFLVPLLSRGGAAEITLLTVPLVDDRPFVSVQVPMEGVRVAW
jgi:hypothetical protein